MPFCKHQWAFSRLNRTFCGFRCFVDWHVFIEQFLDWTKHLSCPGILRFLKVWKPRLDCKPFSDFGNLKLLRKLLSLVSLCLNLSRPNGPAKQMNLSDSKVDFLFCPIQSCLANALEDFPNVPGKLLCIVIRNPSFVQVRSTLIILDNCVLVLAHEIWKCRQRSA